MTIAQRNQEIGHQHRLAGSPGTPTALTPTEVTALRCDLGSDQVPDLATAWRMLVTIEELQRAFLFDGIRRRHEVEAGRETAR